MWIETTDKQAVETAVEAKLTTYWRAHRGVFVPVSNSYNLLISMGGVVLIWASLEDVPENYPRYSEEVLNHNERIANEACS